MSTTTSPTRTASLSAVAQAEAQAAAAIRMQAAALRRMGIPLVQAVADLREAAADYTATRRECLDEVQSILDGLTADLVVDQVQTLEDLSSPALIALYEPDARAALEAVEEHVCDHCHGPLGVSGYVHDDGHITRAYCSAECLTSTNGHAPRFTFATEAGPAPIDPSDPARQVEAEVDVPCPTCEGTGQVHDALSAEGWADLSPCPDCIGLSAPIPPQTEPHCTRCGDPSIREGEYLCGLCRPAVEAASRTADGDKKAAKTFEHLTGSPAPLRESDYDPTRDPHLTPAVEAALRKADATKPHERTAEESRDTRTPVPQPVEKPARKGGGRKPRDGRKKSGK